MSSRKIKVPFPVARHICPSFTKIKTSSVNRNLKVNTAKTQKVYKKYRVQIKKDSAHTSATKRS